MLPLLILFLTRRTLLRFILIAIAGAPFWRTFFFHCDPTNLFTWYTPMPCRADSLHLGVIGAIALRDPQWRGWLLGNRGLVQRAIAILLLGVAYLGWRAPSATLVLRGRQRHGPL